MTSTIKVDTIQDSGGNTIISSDGSGTITQTASIGSFSSTGIDDNASSTAITINSSDWLEIKSNSYLLWGIGSTARPGIIGDNVNKVLAFHNNNSERMRIDSSGNVLVGTTDFTIGYSDGDTGVALEGANGYIGIARSPSASTQALAYLNRLNSDGDIVQFRKDGTTVGSIGANGGDAYIGTGDTGIRFRDVSDAIIPFNTSGSIRDNAISLGEDVYRFKDAYLSGSVYLGGVTSANALNDYEEGTFTVTNAGDATGTIFRESGEYTKIGRMVYVRIVFDVDVNFSGYAIGGLPFQVDTDASGGSSWTPANVLTDNSANNQIIPKFANGTSNIYFDENDLNNDHHQPNTTNNFYRVSGWYITNS